jgi:hypothetical protein
MEPRPGLVNELAARAHLPRDTARDVLDVLNEIDQGRPRQDDVEQLIERARHHALGLSFLLEGNLECVAITFRTHVFHVEDARRRLAGVSATP